MIATYLFTLTATVCTMFLWYNADSGTRSNPILPPDRSPYFLRGFALCVFSLLSYPNLFQRKPPAIASDIRGIDDHQHVNFFKNSSTTDPAQHPTDEVKKSIEPYTQKIKKLSKRYPHSPKQLKILLNRFECPNEDIYESINQLIQEIQKILCEIKTPSIQHNQRSCIKFFGGLDSQYAQFSAHERNRQQQQQSIKEVLEELETIKNPLLLFGNPC